MERNLVFPNEEEKQNIASILLKAAEVDDKLFTQEYTVHVVSPMIWGDEGSREAIVNDAPFRSTSIRGQLRFWWRATRGAAYDNTAELRKQETILFGDTDFPSPLKVVVKELEKRLLGGKEKKKHDYFRFSNLPRYVTFPFQESMREAVYGTFKLIITVPSDMKETYEQEICPAIWAWINFGGIGARTRRGCGSLYCQQFSPNENENIHAWYQHKSSSYKLVLPSIQAEPKHEWPVLCSQLLCNPNKDSFNDFNDAWERVITVYKNFRCLPNPKKKTTNKKLRRSLWPEADFIRKYTKIAKTDHKNSQKLDQVAEIQPAFPRAQFGLPIQFEFKKKHSKTAGHLGEKHREPYKSELTPADNKNRLASPLILKALAVGSAAKSRWEGKGQAIIAVLKQPKLEKLSLRLVHDGHSSHQRHWKNIQRKLERLSITEEHIYLAYPYSENYGHRNHGYSTEQQGATKKSSTTSAIEAFLFSKEVVHWWSNNRL